MKKISYDELPFLPNIIAETVCSQEYAGQEWSIGVRSPMSCEAVEVKRQAMTAEQVSEFADAADKLCARAYSAKAKWFMDIVKAKGNKGRDQLYVWIRHWMTSYLLNPNQFVLGSLAKY